MSTNAPGKFAKSAAIDRRIARPSAAHDAGKGEPANPPPVTHSYTNSLNDCPESIARMSCPVVPVLDLKEGKAVHAVAGRRAYYQPIRSILHPTCEPVALARAIRDTLGLHTVYVADLGAIKGEPANLRTYTELLRLDITLWLDIGIRDVDSLVPLLGMDGSRLKIVVGLETLRGPSEFERILRRAGAERVIFSLDLYEGRPIAADPHAWPTDDPWKLVTIAIERGVCHILALDLARVGTGRGPGTRSLIARLSPVHPRVRFSVGGGISRIEEVTDLTAAGAHSALVGSALHDGRIGRAQIDSLRRATPGNSSNLDTIASTAFRPP